MLYQVTKRTLKHSLKIDEIISTCVSFYKMTHCLKIIKENLEIISLTKIQDSQDFAIPVQTTKFTCFFICSL